MSFVQRISREEMLKRRLGVLSRLAALQNSRDTRLAFVDSMRTSTEYRELIQARQVMLQSLENLNAQEVNSDTPR